MTKIEIFSGFLGAGKTTLIRKLIKEAYAGEKLVLIENEFGEIGIDGGFLKDSDIEITEMNSGCICCSLVGDFEEALGKVLDQFTPDRILIEPSGVGKLSDVAEAVKGVLSDEVVIDGLITVVDAKRCRIYMKNFGEFFNNQVETAGAIILSRTGGMDGAKLVEAVNLLREKNPNAVIVTTPWDQLTGEQLKAAIEHRTTLDQFIASAHEEHHHHDDEDEDEHEHHHHRHDDDDEDEHEHHHHHHDDDEDEHEHHHHHHDDDEDEHEHHHHHDHDHHHHHHHDGEHDADEIFDSWGVETTKKFTADGLKQLLEELENESSYGMVLRAKGIVPAEDGSWLHFDYTPGECDVRTGPADITGRLCVIGAELRTDAVKELFGL